jgi:hypothetical protein
MITLISLALGIAVKGPHPDEGGARTCNEKPDLNDLTISIPTGIIGISVVTPKQKKPEH